VAPWRGCTAGRAGLHTDNACREGLRGASGRLVSISDPIIRLAAKGDGVTASGRHVTGGVPGDAVDADGNFVHGPHHIAPACRHFATCGGCQLQQADDAVLADFVHDRVVNAAKGQGLEPAEVLPVHLSSPHTRRRAGLHGLRTARGAVLGYREGGSHRVVDLAECPVLHPALASLIAPLRAFTAAHGPKAMVGIDLTLADQGIDVALTHFPLEGLGPTEAALDFARDNALARLTIDQGYGPETLWEPEPVTVTLAGVPVGLPPGAFLQATADAERRMVADAADWLGDARLIADLFAGLGTFAFGRGRARRASGLQERRCTGGRSGAGAPPRSVPLAARSGGAEPLRRRTARSAPRRRARSGGRDCGKHAGARGLCQLQSVKLGARCGGAGRGGLPANETAARGPVPVVDPC
jgi:23S rRNA (uracil1939-C5)-methyltransferase